MRVLVIGANGQLGWELCRRGKQEGFEIVSLDLPEFDITHRSAVQDGVNQAGASLVINAAAYTAVDQAESEPELAYAANRDGPAYLASSCTKAGLPLIHVSTDYVFDGNKDSPYLEEDPVCPLGVYGKSKAEGEIAIRRYSQKHIILRTAWLYGVQGHNFVKTMLRLGSERELLRVVADQYGCPTYAGDLADAILSIACRLREGHNINWGTYHCCGKGTTTWHGFAVKILELARQHISLKAEKIDPIGTAEYPTPAKRPASSVLDCSLIGKCFGIQPRPWQNALEDMINQILSTDDLQTIPY